VSESDESLSAPNTPYTIERDDYRGSIERRGRERRASKQRGPQALEAREA